MTETIVLIVDDLMFLPKLGTTLGNLGYQSVAATTEPDLVRALGKAPVLVIVDLFSQSFDWQSLIRFIKGPHKKANHVPVLGFGPHVDLALRQQALDTGCNAVVARSAIAKTKHFAPTCMGINIDKLLTDAQAIRQELERLGPNWPGEFEPHLLPTIELSK